MADSGASARSRRWYRLQVRARRQFNRLPLREHQKIFVLTLIVGAASGLAAVSFHLLLDFLQDNIIYRAAAVAHWWRVPLIIAIPTLGGLIAGAGLFFLAPEARGSGIPQVKTAFYLDGGRIPFRVIPAKMLLSAFNIGTGASLGREGPSVQICAAIASLCGRVFAISRSRLQSLIPIGSAAGLAAAFNTPIAAVTFTLEEILGDSAAKPLGAIVVAAVIAAVIERSVLGENPIFSVPPYRLNAAIELVAYAILGLLAGGAATLFNVSLLKLRAFFARQRLIPQWAAPGAGGLILSGIGVAALVTTGSASIFGVGYGQLSVELQGGLPLKILVILCLLKLAATVVSYSSGSSGGIFGPSLYIGGMLGGAVGVVTQSVLHAHAAPGAFALVGMGAVFAGVVRAPVTSILMIFEMTNSYSIILPLMLANITSYAVASRLSPTPIYDALLLQDGIHLPHMERHLLREHTVGSAMTRDVVTVSASLTVAEAFEHVQQLPRHHHSYPVVDGGGKLAGIFTFNDLKRALANGKANAKVLAACSRGVVHAHVDHTLDRVMLKLGKSGVSQLPVVSRKDTTKLLGIITMHDIVEALSRDHSSESSRPVPDEVDGDDDEINEDA